MDRYATIQTTQAGSRGATVIHMSDRKKPDPRTVKLAHEINALALARGYTQNQFAAAAGFKSNQWSALLHKRSGIGDAKLHNAAAEVGKLLVLAGVDNERPSFLGKGLSGGRVVMSGSSTLPAYVAIDEACDEYQPGDEVIIIEGGYAPGLRLLLSGPEGLFFADAFEHNGEQRLRTLAGVKLDYDPELFTIIGVEDGFRRRRRRPAE